MEYLEKEAYKSVCCLFFVNFYLSLQLIIKICRVPRSKRQVEGSGEANLDDEDDEDYLYDDESEDDEEDE